jgi:hypothetical protein
MKPFINREVNFKLYTELLIDKLDSQRISISIKEFKDIDFPCLGIPKLYLKIC